MNTRISWAVWLLLCLPLLAQAGTYKCKQPDGRMSFQDHPCPAGAVATPLALPQAAVAPPVASAEESTVSSKRMPRRRDVATFQEPPQRDSASLRAEDEVRRQNLRIEAENQRHRCREARQQLGVLKEFRPVYSRDNRGDRHYLEDDRRQAAIVAAERRVAEDCR